MEHDFWRRRWEKNEIGFHENAPNALLVRHFDRLPLREGARIFLPLCGKTRDIHWLLSHGLRVVGAELSKIAIAQLFADLDMTPDLTADVSLVRHSAENIEIFQGDIFDLTAGLLGPVDLVYDRAALVALPREMRPRYTAHIAAITRAAPQFLISYVYDQSAMDGPPFSVPNEELHRLYGSIYGAREPLESVTVAGGLRGKCAATENAWLLRGGQLGSPPIGNAPDRE